MIITSNFKGSIFSPQKDPIDLTGRFVYDGQLALEGTMNRGDDLRNKVQGVWINTQRFNILGNLRSILMFANFGDDLFNHHFYLVKEGLDFEGAYIGRMDINGGRVKGINPELYIENARYLDSIVKDNNLIPVELIVDGKVIQENAEWKL